MKKASIICLILLFGLITCPASAQTDLPEALKREAPLYPGGDVLQSMEMQGNAIAVIAVSCDPKEAFEFYKKELMKTGWAVEMEVLEKEHLTLMMTREEKNFMVDVGRDQNGTTLVNLTLACE